MLLRPAIEAALFPTVAYAAGPGELAYFPQAAPLHRAVGVEVQTAVPRWAGVLIEARVDKVFQRHGIAQEDLGGPPGALEARLVRESLPPDIAAALATLRHALDDDYGRLTGAVEKLDPTLKGTVQSARNAALAHAQEIEKKLIAALKRANETVLGQVARARSAVLPTGKPQERVLTYASFAIRYGPALLAALAAVVARWTDGP